MRLVLSCPLVLLLASCTPGPAGSSGSGGVNLPEVSIDPTSHNFWNAPLREDEDALVTLTNKSGLTVKIDSFSVTPAEGTPSDHFQVLGSSTCDVGTDVASQADQDDPDDGTCQLQIRFSPLHQGHYQALLTVNYLLEGDSTLHSIELTVQGDGKLYCGR